MPCRLHGSVCSWVPLQEEGNRCHRRCKQGGCPRASEWSAQRAPRGHCRAIRREARLHRFEGTSELLRSRAAASPARRSPNRQRGGIHVRQRSLFLLLAALPIGCSARASSGIQRTVPRGSVILIWRGSATCLRGASRSRRRGSRERISRPPPDAILPRTTRLPLARRVCLDRSRAGSWSPCSRVPVAQDAPASRSNLRSDFASSSSAFSTTSRRSPCRS